MNYLNVKVKAFPKFEKLLTRKEKGWVLRDMVRDALAQNRQRVRRQEMLDGTKMPARQDGSKKKMFRKMMQAKRFLIRIVDEMAYVIAKDRLAYQHHHGIDQKVKALPPEQLKRESPTVKATMEQAKALQALGFSESVGKIRNRLSANVAGMIINRERKKRGIPSKKNWVIPREERDILGINQQTAVSVQEKARKRLISILERKR